MTSGIHHITLITRKVQANVDFYAGFLGLRLVKQTAGFEDAAQLHLFYGDGEATPGSLVTFLVWEDGAPGRAGYGQLNELSFAIAPGAIGFWLTRALSQGIRMEGPMEEFGEPVLRLKDPDGVIVKLVGTAVFRNDAVWQTDAIFPEHAIRRIYGVTLLTEMPDLTAGFIATHFGYRRKERQGAIQRLQSQSGDIVDVRDAQGFWAAAPGTGTFDHVAFRASDINELEAVHQQLRSLNSSESNYHDRTYFQSLYVREPGGVLIEIATDAPGMTVDEPLATLGEALFIPENAAGDAQDLKVMLPQFAKPGEERIVYRELPFVHRFFTPQAPDGTVILLLHGSGGNETSLLPLAHRACPAATLMGIRGRSVEEGVPRWFRRFDALNFDEDDIRSQAEAFEAFVNEAVAAYGIDPGRLVFAGHSNGANFLAAIMQLHPALVRRAVLLRPLQPLKIPPQADLSGTLALVVTGKADVYRQEALPLVTHLRHCGCNVADVDVAAGHDAAIDDALEMAAWLAALPDDG